MSEREVAGARAAAALSMRPMTRDDLDRVMVNEVRAYEFPWTRGIFVDCLLSAGECWVAVADGEIVGHGVLGLGAGESHLLNLCVGREHHGRGFGRRLALHLIERAHRNGAEVMFLEVRPSNRVAGLLYESLGFNEVGRRRNYYPAANGHEDALVLALQLLPEPASR